MRKVIVPVTYRMPVIGKDGKPIRRAVDQTPVSKQYKALNGFYHNDLHMLRLASDKGDKALFDALASRLSGLQPSPANGKTIKQLFDEWKPLYIQTPCEESAWLEYLHNCEPALYDRLYGDDDRKYEETIKSVKSDDVGSDDVKSESL